MRLEILAVALMIAASTALATPITSPDTKDRPAVERAKEPPKCEGGDGKPPR